MQKALDRGELPGAVVLFAHRGQVVFRSAASQEPGVICFMRKSHSTPRRLLQQRDEHAAGEMEAFLQ